MTFQISRAAVVAALLLGLALPASAQDIPPLSVLPSTVTASNPELASRRATLAQQRSALHGRIDSLNAQCASVAKGSAAATACLKTQAELLAQLNAHIRESKDFNSVAQAATITSTSPSTSPVTDPMVVDARNVPSGLPKSVEAEIPDTPAGNRIRKGFEAIKDHDWNVAHAWFQDALNHEPGNAGIQRLVDLAEYTMKRAKQPLGKPAPDTSAQDKAAMNLLDQQLDAKMNADLAKGLNDFNRDYKVSHARKDQAGQ